MIKKAFQTGVVASLMAAANPAWGIRRGIACRACVATPTGTQVTLDLSGGHVRKSCSRWIIPAARSSTSVRPAWADTLRLPLGAGAVSGFRIGIQPGGTLRFVMQLKSATSMRSAWMPGPGGPAARHHFERCDVVRRGRYDPAPAAVAPAMSASVASFGVGSESDSLPRVVRAAHAPVDTGRDVVVAVDAGHGGQDPGAIGHGGTREKDVTLAIARALAERINGEPGMRAILTRNRDEFLVLRDRIGRARIARADMFISVHADSIANREVSGASVYVLSEHGATNEAARWLADRENAADLMGGVKLDDKDKQLASVLLDLSQSANISSSMVAAQQVLGSLDAVGQVRKSQVQQAGFVVLKSPDIPSMLVETAYISNPQEEVSLRNNRHQAALAEAIFNGLHNYFEIQSSGRAPGSRRHARSTMSTVLAASPTASPAATAS